MSAIDVIWHEVIGQIDGIPLYRLKEDVPANRVRNLGIDGKKGDILLGGGSGEASAIRFSMPECIEFFTAKEDSPGYQKEMDEIVRHHWSILDCYHFVNDFKKIGYKEEECQPETWLAEHIVSYIIQKESLHYDQHIGDQSLLDYDGSICSPPEKEWMEHVETWFKDRK